VDNYQIYGLQCIVLFYNSITKTQWCKYKTFFPSRPYTGSQDQDLTVEIQGKLTRTSTTEQVTRHVTIMQWSQNEPNNILTRDTTHGCIGAHFSNWVQGHKIVIVLLSHTCRVWKCLTLAPRWAPVSQKCRIRKFHEWASHRAPLLQMCRILYRCIWSGRQYCTIVIKLRSRTSTLDKRVARSRLLTTFCRLEHEILFSGRAASEHVRKSLLFYIQFVWVLWIGTKLDLTC